ncbi:hypothetical protein [Candidatus Solincola tengchongensis]|uniref:hypothetical protein n=1 Tax=Candidatus Solincola tengchongensis TaxID=2900693 RepID=UPI00257ADD26|nr:hypothetical protein [Candidatus Solincola tengchongensis]
MEERGEERTVICRCPFCESEIEAAVDMPAFCQPCQIVIVTCSACGGAAREGTEICPHCGQPLPSGE